MYASRETRHVVEINLGLLEPLGITAGAPRVSDRAGRLGGGRGAIAARRPAGATRCSIPARRGRTSGGRRRGLRRVAARAARAARPDVGRAVGTGRGRDCARGRRGGSRRRGVLSPPTTIADLVALARGAARDGVGRHRADAHRRRGRHADRRHLRTDAAGAQRSVAAGRRHGVARGVCQCHHLRRCRLERMCLLDIEVDEVLAAVERRLAAGRRAWLTVSVAMAVWRGLRVALGFVVRARRALARAADAASRSLRGRGGGARRRGARDLGRGASEQVARGDVVGSVSLGRASALRRVVDDGRRPGGRVGQRVAVVADRCRLSGRRR